MNLSDLLQPLNPVRAMKTITAPFEKRDGMPFVQGAARNLGHAFFGDAVANQVEQRFLGDSPTGQWKGGTPAAASTQSIGQAPTAQPNTPVDPRTLLAALLKAQQLQ